jgi:hypothetical protein
MSSIRAVRVNGSSSAGTDSRPHCSAASIAWARSRAVRTRSAWVWRVISGTMRRQPSSVAFSTMKSVRAFFTGAKASQRSGGSAWALSRSRQASVADRRPASASSASHSPSRPLNSSTPSPGFRRITVPR